jgi:hypothetical protein
MKWLRTIFYFKKKASNVFEKLKNNIPLPRCRQKRRKTIEKTEVWQSG